jgi:hypothetical protein
MYAYRLEFGEQCPKAAPSAQNEAGCTSTHWKCEAAEMASSVLNVAKMDFIVPML